MIINRVIILYKDRVIYLENWHSKTTAEIYEKLKTSNKGLSDSEAKTRLEKNGLNELVKEKQESIFKIIFRQLNDAMIIILFIASLISFVLDQTAEGIVILVIIVINTVISVVEEKKANTALEALKKMNSPIARVLREDEESIIEAKELVIGDIVLLEAGSVVPADLRLIESYNLKIDESSLTGESVAAMKNADEVLDEKTPLADCSNMAYSSTFISYGTGMGVVVATGMKTQIGKIAKMLNQTDELTTPLKQKLNSVGKTLSVVGLIISLFIFIIGILYGNDVVTILMLAISLAISVIPEGLPATATIIMALGVQRMAEKNALIRKLPAVETLGSTTVICSDKTGTLTQNKMTVVKYAMYDEFVNGKVKSIDEFDGNQDMIYASCLCNNSNLDPYNEDQIIGDPTEGAFILLAKKLGINQNELEDKYPKVFEQPFDSKRKMMSTIHNVDGVNIVYTKGGIDEILSKSSKIIVKGKQKKLTDELKKQIIDLCLNMSDEALRVLGFAKKEIKKIPSDQKNDIEHDLTFIGVFGMIDPVREEVIGAIKTCHQAGIKIVMITGDHKQTARAIGKQLGIYEDKDNIISGEELNNLSEKELIELTEKTTIFARVSPEDKLKIVNAFKSKGEVVAMTGDGVNDAPALKTADIGITMGKTGTDVSKDAADMILLDDNFTTIELAIREGRRIYSNIQKVIQYLLAGNISEVLVIFVATILNLGAPIYAVHILLINLITDTIPALALGVDPENKDVMKRKPIKSGTFFEKGLVFRVIFYGILIASITLFTYVYGLRYSNSIAVTMAFSVLAISQIVHALNQHSAVMSVFSKDHPKNKYLYGAMIISVLILMIIIFVKPLADFFHIYPLTLNQWMLVILVSLIPLIVVEIFKWFRRNV